MELTFSTEGMDERDAQFFTDMLAYASPHVLGSRREAACICVECAEGHADEVAEKVGQLRDMLAENKLSGQESPIRTLLDRTDRTPAFSEPIFADMVERGIVRELAPGSLAYSGIYLAVWRYFTRKVEEFAHSTFPGIQEMTFPVLYPVAEYERGGYFKNFPHYIMFQTTMRNDVATLARFAEKGCSDPSIFEEMSAPRNVLRHAACAPVYGMLEHARLAAGEGRAFLVSGTCFRDEAGNARELSRCNEFTMKECVFVGSPEYCAENMARARAIWRHWADTFGLACKVDTANDSFFASNYRMMSFFQLLGDSKQEFKWLLPFSGEYISASSANVHRTHFSKPYDIRQADGSLCNSSCFAFGVERLSYALLAQKGLDPAKWDEATRAEVGRYVDLAL